MNFTIIGPVYPYRGGIAHFTTLLARALMEKHETTVISFSRQYPKLLYPGSSDKDNSQEPLIVSADYLLDPLLPWTWFLTSSRITHARPDLLIIPWWTTFWAPGFASICHLVKRQSIRTLFLIHNVLPHEVRFFDRWLGRIALKQADYFIVQSEREMRNLHKVLPDANATLFPHPIYDALAKQRIDKNQARERYNLPPDASVALFFGIVRPYKGLIHLIHALGNLKNRGEIVYLVIAGEFWEDESLYRREIEKLNLCEQIHIDNRYIPNEEIGIIFSAADVYVAPYTSGTQSGAVRIAVGFGLPSIVSDAVADTALESFSNIFFVTPSDPEAMASRLSEVFSAIRAGKITRPVNNTPSGWSEMVEKIEIIALEGTSNSSK